MVQGCSIALGQSEEPALCVCIESVLIRLTYAKERDLQNEQYPHGALVPYCSWSVGGMLTVSHPPFIVFPFDFSPEAKEMAQ